MQPIKDAASICKTIMRNGFDAYIINLPLQQKVLELGTSREIDICTDMDFDNLSKLFPDICKADDAIRKGVLTQNGVTFSFYQGDVGKGSYIDASVTRLTPRLVRELGDQEGLFLDGACPTIPQTKDVYDGFEDFSSGEIKLVGLPDETLKRDYLLAIRALRFSANYNLPIETNTWLSLLRSARRVADYVRISDIMDEWRKVEAENMYKFVQYLLDTMIIPGIIPELMPLTRIHLPAENGDSQESLWDHMIATMRHYPEELPYDWYGTLACMFLDIGKVYTGESFNGKLFFFQHHQVGAKVTRKILRRLGFDPEDIDLICHLVKHHMRFHFMLNDKGIRRFKGLDEYPRLIELARAEVKASNGTYTEFNHNMKMLERADIDEDMLEPLLNGQKIMELAKIHPGPMVGLIREALLQAQISGDVSNVEEAKQFVLDYKEKEKIQ
ncbi:HD domain-containing protein [Desulfoplanes formicivorans]|uniref:HD family phosphohydrolase n=1 Tax=Desulfoplanes formicivorans TaxID=1592317 RepID=A0A194AER6_9BACT|nr:HD domain-containing protein [Desulfoplanes formicivorans]GAU08567.1 HD family phosphohydrolase [Desulfoplanes formicivorans]